MGSDGLCPVSNWVGGEGRAGPKVRLGQGRVGEMRKQGREQPHCLWGHHGGVLAMGLSSVAHYPEGRALQSEERRWMIERTQHPPWRWDGRGSQ